MRYFILTSNIYAFLLNYHQKFWEKYWGDEDITMEIIGYGDGPENLPDNFIFHSLGSESDWGDWATPLINFFEKIDGDVPFFLTLEDHFPVQPVNLDKMSEAIKFITDDNEIQKIFIHPGYGHNSRLLDNYKDNWFVIDNFKDGKRTSIVWASLAPSIWRTSFFISLLKNNVKSLYDFEVNNSNLSGYKVLISKTDVYITLDAMRRGKFNSAIFMSPEQDKRNRWLNTEDIQIFKDIEVEWNERQKNNTTKWSWDYKWGLNK